MKNEFWKMGCSSCFQFSTKMRNENFSSFSYFIFQILRKINWHSGTQIQILHVCLKCWAVRTERSKVCTEKTEKNFGETGTNAKNASAFDGGWAAKPQSASGDASHTILFAIGASLRSRLRRSRLVDRAGFFHVFSDSFRVDFTAN